MNRDLSGVGPWDQIGGADEIEELLLGEPSAFLDHFVMHERDVCRRAAEGHGAESEEEPREFADHGR